MDFLNTGSMKSILLKIIIPVFILFLISPALRSQEIKSQKVKILVNTMNKPAELIPDILLLEPRTMKIGETFMPDQQSITLVMKIINPAQGIKILVNNVEIEPTAAGDLYTHLYTLVKGANSLYISLMQRRQRDKRYGLQHILY